MIKSWFFVTAFFLLYAQFCFADKKLELVFTFGNQGNKKTLNDVTFFEKGMFEFLGDSLSSVYVNPGEHLFFTTKKTANKNEDVSVFIKVLFPESGASIEFLKKEFIKSLKTADVIFYSGHSRGGSGFPDFATKFTNDGKVFYFDSDRGWRGFSEGLLSPSKYQILVINSCKSGYYYLKPIREQVWEKLPSSLGLILTSSDTLLEDNAAVSLAFFKSYLEDSNRDQILSAMNRAAEFFNLKWVASKTPQKLFFSNGLSAHSYIKTPLKKTKVDPWSF